MIRPRAVFVGWPRPHPVPLVSSRSKLEDALPDLSWSPVPNRCSKKKRSLSDRTATTNLDRGSPVNIREFPFQRVILPRNLIAIAL
jgi:hypothetical protein